MSVEGGCFKLCLSAAPTAQGKRRTHKFRSSGIAKMPSGTVPVRALASRCSACNCFRFVQESGIDPEIWLPLRSLQQQRRMGSRTHSEAACAPPRSGRQRHWRPANALKEWAECMTGSDCGAGQVSDSRTIPTAPPRRPSWPEGCQTAPGPRGPCTKKSGPMVSVTEIPSGVKPDFPHSFAASAATYRICSRSKSPMFRGIVP